MAARRLTTMVAAGVTSLWRVLLPVAGVAFGRHAGVLALGAAAIRSKIRCGRWPSSRTRPSRSTTLFDGRFVPASDLPWEYLPTYLLLALPELVLVLLVAAAVAAATGLMRRGVWGQREAVLGLFLLGFTIVFPVAYAIAIKAVLFDGMRHFILSCRRSRWPRR